MSENDKSTPALSERGRLRLAMAVQLFPVFSTKRLDLAVADAYAASTAMLDHAEKTEATEREKAEEALKQTHPGA